MRISRTKAIRRCIVCFAGQPFWCAFLHLIIFIFVHMDDAIDDEFRLDTLKNHQPTTNQAMEHWSLDQYYGGKKWK